MQDEYLELHLVCFSGFSATKLNICGASENTNKGVLMRHVNLNIMGNTLYP